MGEGGGGGGGGERTYICKYGVIVYFDCILDDGNLSI